MKISIRALAPLVLAITAYSHSASAVVYPLPAANSRLTGENLAITLPVDNKLPLEAFAARYQMGLSNMLEANPGVDVYLPRPGSKLVIPHQLLLPDAPREGIIINSAEMRLYYYPKGTKTVVVLPIGIGELGKDTPINWTTTVERKKEGPTWTPTKKMHEEYNARGQNLPDIFPAGPDNPMGLYALYIGRMYAIHGTNANFGIGLRVSHGCVRLRTNDIKWLFDNVPAGTRVQFIDQPVKASVEPDGSRLIEVHNPLSQTEEQFNSTDPVPLSISPAVSTVIGDASVDQAAVDAAMKTRSGIPTKINGAVATPPPAETPATNDIQPNPPMNTPVMPQGVPDATQQTSPSSAPKEENPASPAPAQQAPSSPAPAPAHSTEAHPDDEDSVVVPSQPAPIYEHTPGATSTDDIDN